MSEGAQEPPFRVNVATVPPGVPFLETLVETLLDGRLVEGFRPLEGGRLDPLKLAEATIYVPSRRAKRNLAAAFVGRLEADAALLPDIRALGDADEDGLMLDDAFAAEAGLVEGEPTRLAPTIDPLERQLLLTTLVRRWWDRLSEVTRALYGEADIVVPSSLADATWFARDLANLMDAVSTEEADWARLDRMGAQDAGQWWQLTAEFLRIATEIWPALLEERGVMDPTERRARMIDRVTKGYTDAPPAGPVIVAGATGSNPAVARMMRAVARMKRGLVVLPGLDTYLDDETWDALADPNGDPNETATHPQHALKRLLQVLGCVRGGVRVLAETNDERVKLRERVVSEALRPAEATAAWKTLGVDVPEGERARAFERVSFVEAQNEREEASAIACAMRETLDDGDDSVVALVTPDRNLARRVSVELERFQVRVDDSAGQPLASTPAGTFARLLLAVGCGEADVVTLMALVKHPRLRLGFADHARAGRLYELTGARGQVVPPVPGDLAGNVARARARLLDAGESRVRVHPSVERLSEEDWDEAEAFASAFDRALEPLLALRGTDTLTFEALVEATVRAYEACAEPGEDVDPDPTRAVEPEGIYSGEDGEAMAAQLAALRDVRAPDIDVALADWPGMFEALMADRVVRRRGHRHPRAFIWGPLEARLQSADRVVLGGLNEETWPAGVRNDAFLSRPMKSQLPLEPPERRIGLAAHDIQMLLGVPDVVLTRAARAGGKPTVASRWWQRIEAVAGEEAQSAMRRRGGLYRKLARDLDRTDRPPEPAPRPAPTPPLDVRPRVTTFTEVERYVRDPYAVYARRILKLEPAEPLLMDVDVAERGTLFHAIMEQWTRGRHDARDPGALDTLLAVARVEFAKVRVPEATSALWWPRFEEIAHDFLEWERERADAVRVSRVEVGAAVDGAHMRLVGLADRVDVMRDGSVAIIDYKTGTTPSVKQAETLTAPQLPLEAAAVARGGFKGMDAHEASELAYVRLRPGGQFRVDRVGRVPDATGRAADKPEPAVLGQTAWEEFERLMARFADPSHPYTSRTRPMKAREYSTEYDHLARVPEWMLAEEDADEGEYGW